MPANYTKWTNIWENLTPLDSSQLEVFLRFFWEFFIFWNLNLNFEFRPVGYRPEPEPARTGLTGNQSNQTGSHRFCKPWCYLALEPGQSAAGQSLALLGSCQLCDLEGPAWVSRSLTVWRAIRPDKSNTICPKKIQFNPIRSNDGSGTHRNIWSKTQILTQSKNYTQNNEPTRTRPDLTLSWVGCGPTFFDLKSEVIQSDPTDLLVASC